MNLPRVYMCSPSWTLSHLPPHTIPLGHPSAPAPSILYLASNLDWQFVSYMILYTFQCHSLPTPLIPSGWFPGCWSWTPSPCLSPTPRVYSNLCPLSQWCHPTISSSVIPLSSHLQSFPASRSFQMSQFFASGGQSIGVSASTSVLPMNIQDWFSLGWTGWISLQSKGLSRVFSNTRVQKHQFFSAQLSSQSNFHIHTWPLEKPQPWFDGPLLAK